MRETLPVVAGTLVSQTLLNLLALLLLAVVVVGSNDILRGREGVLILVSLLPLALAAAVLIVPSLVEASRRAGFGARREGTLARMAREAAAALVRLRKGLAVFRRPRLGGVGDERTAGGLGAPAAGRLRAAAGPGARPPCGPRRGRRGAVRGERDRGAAGHAVERRGCSRSPSSPC